jgi:hypothetical protein
MFLSIIINSAICVSVIVSISANSSSFNVIVLTPELNIFYYIILCQNQDVWLLSEVEVQDLRILRIVIV